MKHMKLDAKSVHKRGCDGHYSVLLHYVTCGAETHRFTAIATLYAVFNNRVRSIIKIYYSIGVYQSAYPPFISTHQIQ